MSYEKNLIVFNVGCKNRSTTTSAKHKITAY